MDSERFDSLTRRLAAPATRRRALGAAATSGFLGALGLGRGDVALAAQMNGGVCSIPFTSVVRDGPSANRPLTRGGQPGELSGTLRFSLGGDGHLVQAALQLSDGTSLPVVGQATGFALQARIQLAPNLAVVAVGVGEQEVAACAGAIDGPASGPQVGDIGDWHAGSAAQQAAGSGGRGNRDKDNAQGAAGGQGGRGNRTRGQGGGQAGASGAAATGSGGNGGGGGGRNGGRNQGGGNGGNGGGGNGGGRNTQQPVPPLADGTCPPQRSRCGDACYDLETDPAHCGRCGNACNQDEFEVCEAGACTTPGCLGAGDLVYCGPEAGCVDVRSEHDHCGRCGNMCRDAQCVNGACSNSSAQCTNGETLCDGECTDLNFDDLNCGRCGAMCAISDVCNDGVCGPVQCPPGTTLCGLACVNLQTAPQNCGTCDTSCAPEQFCSAGVCTAITTCQPGDTFCRDAGGCRYLMSDQANCGECGVSCVPGWDCRGGQCIFGGDPTRCVQPGLYYCDGKCVQIEFDPNNCGLCGITCGSGEVCQQFACVLASVATVCPAGQHFCSGACVDLMNDSNNCGMCGTSCGGPQCIQGFCGGPDVGYDPCASRGFTNCSGVCVDLTQDPLNCGVCGAGCLDGRQCVSGSCVAPGSAPALAPANDCASQGLTLCGDQCVDPLSDVFNCGACGTVCGVFDSCVNGLCQAPEDQGQASTADVSTDAVLQPEGQPGDKTDAAPVLDTLACGAGLTDCSGTCADLASDPSNCGICGISCGFDSCVGGMCVAADALVPAEAPAEIPADAVLEELPPLVADCSAQGLTDCGGVCIDTVADPFNCGGCGLVCAEGQTCNGGACA